MDWMDRIAKSACERRVCAACGVHQTPERVSTRGSPTSWIQERRGARKIESLDVGRNREIIRKNDEMFCYQPDIQDHPRGPAHERPVFPGLDYGKRNHRRKLPCQIGAGTHRRPRMPVAILSRKMRCVICTNFCSELALVYCCAPDV